MIHMHPSCTAMLLQLEDLEHDDPAHWGPGLTYAFLSPIFDSISKQGEAQAKVV